MKIDLGKGTPVWLSPRQDGGLITMQGSSRLLLNAEELQAYVDGIHQMTGIRSGGPNTTTPAKAQLRRFGANPA